MEQPHDIPPMPIKPCNVCNNTIFYLRRGVGKPQWTCMKCHPNPNPNEKGAENESKS